MESKSLLTPVTAISGVGKVTADKLARLGVTTLKDLVFLFPRAYEHRGNIRLLSQATPDTPIALILTVATEVRSATLRKGMSISKFRALDESGSIEVLFFNSKYVKEVFHIGTVYRFYGKLTLSGKRLQLVNPKYEPFVKGVPLPEFTPIYPLTSGITSKQIDKLMRIAINDVLPNIKDPLPDDIRLRLGLPTLSFSLINAHFPGNSDDLYKSMRRLAFDEILTFGLGIALMSAERCTGNAPVFSNCSLEPLTNALPYELTQSQKNAINDIYRDTVRTCATHALSPMARILVGDVGCGKTICAIAAMYIAVCSKYQCALMVPTEILARQHYHDVFNLFSALGIRTELLLGSTTQKEKKRIQEDVTAGEVDVVIGTHALISDKIEFARLGLVITDEQHRFGVRQRARLKEKSNNAHMLVMSATPIPRTLALTMYGDLDVSRITDMPKGRQKVDTFVVDESYRLRMNEFIKKQIAVGGRCYIVCPSIEAEEEIELSTSLDYAFDNNTGGPRLKNVADYTEELKKALPGISIATLHGRMTTTEKDDTMLAFSRGDVQILVSTTVIEVGVNVPEATLIIVENAERFGLSQLHQLRGRVGRGNKKSYCILVSDIKSEKSTSRLEVMRTTYDGYAIAEKDLAIRGPGDFFSRNSLNNMRQSGGFEFKFASTCEDTRLFDEAFSIAKAIVEADPTLTMPEHAELRSSVESALVSGASSIS